MRILFLILIVSIALASLHAVTYEDVIYCQNGDIIRGLIIETVPSEYIKIKVNTSIITVQYDQIVKFSKEEITSVEKEKGTAEKTLGIFAGIKYISEDLNQTYAPGFSGGISLDYWGANDLGFEIALETFCSDSDQNDYAYPLQDIYYPEGYYPYYYVQNSTISITPLTVTLKKSFRKNANGSFFYGGLGAGIYFVKEKVDWTYWGSSNPALDDSLAYDDVYYDYYYYPSSNSDSCLGLNGLVGFQMTNFFFEVRLSQATLNNWNGSTDVGGVNLKAGYRFKL